MKNWRVPQPLGAARKHAALNVAREQQRQARLRAQALAERAREQTTTEPKQETPR